MGLTGLGLLVDDSGLDTTHGERKVMMWRRKEGTATVDTKIYFSHGCHAWLIPVVSAVSPLYSACVGCDSDNCLHRPVNCPTLKGATLIADFRSFIYTEKGLRMWVCITLSLFCRFYFTLVNQEMLRHLVFQALPIRLLASVHIVVTDQGWPGMVYIRNLQPHSYVVTAPWDQFQSTFLARTPSSPPSSPPTLIQNDSRVLESYHLMINNLKFLVDECATYSVI